MMFGISNAVAQPCPMMKGHSEGGEHGKHMKRGMHGKMMKKHMRGKRMSGMKGGMMMRGMAGKKVTPTEDGGIVVQLGHKLIKYDENMNKVGEATIQLSEEDIRQRMEHIQNMRETCREMWEEQEEGE